MIGSAILAGTALQVLWLSVILWSRAAATPDLAAFLIVYSMAVGTFCWFWPFTATRPNTSLTGLLALAVAGGAAFAAADNHSFSDEREIVAIARYIDTAGVKAFFLRYSEFSWLGTRHPPLGPLMYGSAAAVFGSSLLALRAINVACGAALVAVTFVLGRNLYDRATGLIAASLLLAMPYFFRLSGVAMFDVALAALFTLAILLVVSERSRGVVQGLALGGVLGAGLLLKYAMLLAFPVLGLWLWARRRIRQSLVMLAISTVVSAVALFTWVVAADRLGVLDQQARQVEFFITYATTYGRTRRWMFESLLTRLPTGIGVYLLPVLLAGVVSAVRRRERTDVALLASIVFVCVSLLVTIPDPRYFFPIFPLLAIVGARAICEMAPRDSRRILLMVWLHALGSLVLLWGWERQTRLFLLR